jgi:hypothetical protein
MIKRCEEIINVNPCIHISGVEGETASRNSLIIASLLRQVPVEKGLSDPSSSLNLKG